MLKPGLENFEYYFASVWDEFNCAVVWTFFGIAFLKWKILKWKIFKDMGIPDHLTCLLRNLYAGQEEELELDTEEQTGSKLGKEDIKDIYIVTLLI